MVHLSKREERENIKKKKEIARETHLRKPRVIPECDDFLSSDFLNLTLKKTIEVEEQNW